MGAAKAINVQTRRYEASTLASYLEVIKNYPRLDREQEHALAIRARAGDKKARHQLVCHNLALVLAVARQQRGWRLLLDDLIQEGNLGLMRATEKFDPRAGTRFATYAVWWIRAYIGKYLKEVRSSVRPRSGTIAQSDLSLDMTIGEDEETTYLERLEDGQPNPEDRFLAEADDREVRVALGRVKNRLGGLGWDIVHYRLQQDSPRTLEEIGQRWGVSRERVRQIELKTKRFLNRYLGELQNEGGRNAA